MLFKRKRIDVGEQVKTQKPGKSFVWRNFLLSSILCLGLFFVPAIIGNAYAWYCAVVEEVNKMGFLASWDVGFKVPYSTWLDNAEAIKKKHKLQPGVFEEAVGLKNLIANSSNSAALAEIKNKADNIYNLPDYKDNPARSLSDRASTQVEALRDGMAMSAYQTAKKSYQLTLDIDQQLKDFSPSKMDVAATSQIQKDIAKLSELIMEVKAEAMKVEAGEMSVKATLH